MTFRPFALSLALTLVALTVRAQQQPVTPVPARDARETVWSQYIAMQWGKNSYVGKTITEQRLPDDSRVDVVVTWHSGRTVAWEVERAAKWKEAIGQALFYHVMTDSTGGGVVLIALGDPSDKQDILRCLLVCRKIGLDFAIVDEHGVIR